jgi:CHAT domain-containing protein
MTTLASTVVSASARACLRQERDRLEGEIFRKYPDLGLHPTQIADVAAALPLDGALVEVENVASRDCYLAIVLRPDASVELIDLGPGMELDGMIEAALLSTSHGFSDAIELWAEVSKRLITPLLAPLSNVRHWFLSVDGGLHRIPFFALPWPGDSGQWLSDAIELTLLTSGRDLLHLEHKLPGVGSSVVLANPKFDRAIQSCTHNNPPVEGHSRNLASFGNWDPLIGTAEEGRRLAELLGAKLVTEAEASTLNLLQTRRPTILHIATHGYFLPDQPKPLIEGPVSSLDLCRPLESLDGGDPMLRSGLVLAGANQPDLNSQDDGYLTALEATQLDLQGTELVTLSACDTGRGDIRTGEGVYGLQRAIFVAGARSILLSLWKVPDEATCTFMVRFYTLLKQGVGRSQALIAVQREFREHENIVWRDPYFWAAWQLVGDWRQIESLCPPAI